MRMAFEKPGAIGVLIALCVAQGAAAQGAGSASGGSGWYVAVGAGGNWTGGLEQAGYNRDNICYPTNQCPRLPEGYRWYYDLDPDSATVFDLAVGRSLGAVRLEVSASGIDGGIQETFTGITYYDGSPVLPAEDSGYAIEVETAVDGLSTRTLAFNVYRDFSIGAAGAAPYLGIGAGLSSVELSGLYYRDAYSCVSAPCSGDRPAADYNSHQHTDLTDTVWSGVVHAGVDYPLEGSRYSVGLNVSYLAVGDMESEAGYLDHPLPDERNHTKISGMDHWSLALRVRYRLGAR